MTDDHSDPLFDLAEHFVETFAARDIMVTTAESCTGGMISAAITDIAGSSAVLDRAFITYSNAAKTEMVGVDSALIETHGAVSSEVAAAMAEGALSRSDADLAIAVTGIAGPTGGTKDKPVGLVWFACATSWGSTFVTSHEFDDNGRIFIRYHTALYAMEMALEILASRPADDAAPLGTA